MLAREFGYWVSDGNAIDRQATADELHMIAVKQNEDQRGNIEDFAIWTLCVGLILLLIGVLGRFGFEVRTVLLGIGGTAALIAGFAWRNRKIPVNLELRAGFPQLYNHPWQAWPCRMEQAEPDNPETSKFDAIVTLLDPDRGPTARFRGRVTLESWDRMTDGFGLLWICGDLREPVLVAGPGGAPFWEMKRATEPPRLAAPQPGLLDAAADEAIRQASASIVKEWLNGSE